jgi:hypothetical protein
MTAAEFFLGTHEPNWLTSTTVSLFVSDRRLRKHRRLPRARCRWALDSVGFTELSTFGSWDQGPTPAQYARRVRRYRDEIGQLAWAAPQDWMCEPWILAKTGLSVADHRRRTVHNYLTLRDLAPDLPFVPVIQGWDIADYARCVDLYAANGVDLTTAAVVGLGSVCRRQATHQAEEIVNVLHALGVTRLHGFGVKILGLQRYAHRMISADSMVWSLTARHQPLLPGCTHATCANCRRFALLWRDRVVAAMPTYQQLSLFDRGTAA